MRSEVNCQLVLGVIEAYESISGCKAEISKTAPKTSIHVNVFH